jgi:DNA ligase 1
MNPTLPLSRRQLLAASAAAMLLPRAALSTGLAAPALPLLGQWSDTFDPADFLVSEKYDGVRGVWDGTTLRHRSGRRVNAPGWFTAALPTSPLDGELWLARGRFDELSALVRRERPVDAEWRQVRFMVFEWPGGEGRFDTRAQRLAALVAASGMPHLEAVRQTPGTDQRALHERLAQTVTHGGEGLVLHRADAPYATGRSDALLKLKPALDAEATVVAHHPGRGKYAHQLGALEVKADDGRRFLIGTGLSDALRRDPPPLGSVVTYRYRSLTPNGLPRFASYLREHRTL